MHGRGRSLPHVGRGWQDMVLEGPFRAQSGALSQGELRGYESRQCPEGH